MTAARFLTLMKVAPLVGRRDYEGALRILESELAGTVEDSPYLEMIAQCHYQAGNDNRAIETAKKVLALDPDNFKMPMFLSQIYAKDEDHEQAVAYVKIGLKNYESEALPTTPRWLFGVLKFVAKFSTRWKYVEKTAKEDI